MAVSPQVLKLIQMLVPQGGTSSLTRRALARGLTRDEPVPVEDLVELIARRTDSKKSLRDRNFKRNLRKGLRYRTGPTSEVGIGGRHRTTRKEWLSMTKEERIERLKELSDFYKNIPFDQNIGSYEDYKRLNELRQALEELL